MDLSWLAAVRRILIAWGGLRPLSEYLYRRIAWFSLLDQKREREQIMNDGQRLIVAEAHLRFCKNVAKLMKETGLSQEDINAFIEESLLVPVHEYVLARRAAQTQVHDEKMSGAVAPLVERRVMHLPKAARPNNKRIGDREGR